jgi:hypothetical protein
MADTQYLDRKLEDLDKKKASEYTAELRLYAYSCGWPFRTSRFLKVVPVSEGYFAINYPKPMEDEILTLELGTLDVPPNPVMRTFMNRFSKNSGDYNNDLADILNDWRLF